MFGILLLFLPLYSNSFKFSFKLSLYKSRRSVWKFAIVLAPLFHSIGVPLFYEREQSICDQSILQLDDASYARSEVGWVCAYVLFSYRRRGVKSAL